MQTSAGKTTFSYGLEMLEAKLAASGVATVDLEVAAASGLATATDTVLSGVAVPLRAVLAENLKRNIGGQHSS